MLTNKGSGGAPRFRASAARLLAKQLASVQGRRGVLVVMGAGSWGHPQALRHGVGRRVLWGRDKQAALEEITASVAALRTRFCKEAVAVGLPVVPVPAGAFALQSRQLSVRVDPLRWMLAQRLVPVTGGDVIEDPRRGLRILSGDEIAQRLVRPLGARRVVFATDVPGILVDGKPVRRLDRAGARRLIGSMGPGNDATGGMRGKLEQALAILNEGAEVRVVDGRSADALARAARGEAVGTLLRA